MSSSGQKPSAMAAKSPDKTQTDQPVLKKTSGSGTEPKLVKVKSLDESIRSMVVGSKTLSSQSVSPAIKTVPASEEVVIATKVAAVDPESSKKISEKKSTEQKTSRTEPQERQYPVHVAVPRQRAPLPEPILKGRPIVLATHLVPSFPIHLFELIAEAIEVATELPVCLLHESRTDRPVAKEVADVAILPVYGEWEDGELLPVTFVFNHRLNEPKDTGVYVDVVIGTDHATDVEDILDLRGRRCALPDRRQSRGAAALLLRHLRTRGEGPSFFGNILDSGSQLATLQMVAGRQAEVGVLDAPVIKCHKRALAGFNTLHTLGSLGPLPPYPIYVKKSLSSDIRNKICSYLKNVSNDREWKQRFAEYGIHGFASNSKDAYILQDEKDIAISAPYY